MYFRTKRSGGFDYLQVVESHRGDGKPRQSVVATLGRLDALKASGELDRLVRSGARFTESAMLLSAVEKGEATTIEAKRIGPPLLFERLWRDSFCRAVIEHLLVERKFEFPVEHAIFLTVLHRIMDPGSDRAAEKWRTAYAIGGMDQIDLHHLYRAMSWLGEELADQTGRGLAPRTTKDLIEEQVFSRRRNLFNDVGLAIFDTTSLYFEGDGGETLGHNGHSKDARPDLHQMVLGVVIDEDGRPIYKFSTDSPLKTTKGNLECLALFAGQIAGAIETIPSAGGRVGEIVSAARATLERLQRVGTATV